MCSSDLKNLKIDVERLEAVATDGDLWEPVVLEKTPERKGPSSYLSGKERS